MAWYDNLIASTSSFESAFPGFPEADLPPDVFGPEWEDISYRNDGCPRFLHLPSGVAVFCAEANRMDREEIEFPRFLAVRVDFDDPMYDDDAQCDTEEWADVLAFIAEQQATK